MTGRRGPSHSGPYSLACISCFKSKSKCVARPDGDGCQRCYRLKKQCSPSDLLRSRSNEKKQTSAARIAELESKLDGLISQLRQSNSIHVMDSGTTQGESPVLLATSSSSADTIHAHVQPSDSMETGKQHDEHTDKDADNISGALPSRLPPRTERTLETPELQVSEAEGETLLSTFRSCMVPHFPFIHLPAQLTAHQLRLHRPYLFQAIACVSTPSVREKVELGRELKRAICNAMLERKTQATADTVDLLLALLTYISWGWDHVLGGDSILFLVLQAKALAYQIGMQLDGNGSQDMKLKALFFPSFYPRLRNARAETKQEFLECQRAVLGCFVLSSVYSDYFNLGEPMQWRQQMEHRLAAISTDTTGSPTDSLLATQVRLQLLTRKAIEVHQQQQLDQGLTAPRTELATFPALMALGTMQKQLQELKSSLAPGMQQRELIMTHIHSTQLILSETTYKIHSLVPILVSQFARMTATGSINSTSGPSSMDDEITRGTDAVRAVIDVQEVLGRVAEKLELVAQEVGEQEGNEPLGQLARAVRRSCSKSDVISNEMNGDEAGKRKGRDSLWFTTVWGVAGGST